MYPSIVLVIGDVFRYQIADKIAGGFVAGRGILVHKNRWYPNLGKSVNLLREFG